VSPDSEEERWEAEVLADLGEDQGAEVLSLYIVGLSPEEAQQVSV
jgi:DNA-directed RNA polymerase specialized sigma24 family protein